MLSSLCFFLMTTTFVVAQDSATSPRGNSPQVDDFEAHDTDVIMTESGAVSGEVYETGFGLADRFGGIPFAAPPIGELRFMPTRPLTDAQKWSGVRHLKGYGNVCYQIGLTSLSLTQSSDVGDEDCLHLTISRPSGVSQSAKLPVIVYIPGGAFIFGGYPQTFYDGGAMAVRSNAIVVVINHRVGFLGFMGTRDIAGQSGGSAGTFGLQDQREALRWVKRNIGAFGGDPEHVALMGMSSGGVSVLMQLVSPVVAEENLFQAAIAEGPVLNSWQVMENTEDALDLYETLASHLLNCPDTGKPGGQLSCLQQLPLKNIVPSVVQLLKGALAAKGVLPSFLRPKWFPKSAPVSFPFTFALPMVDGHRSGLPESPWAALLKGQIHKVPVILSGGVDEGSSFKVLGNLLIPGVVGIPGLIFGKKQWYNLWNRDLLYNDHIEDVLKALYNGDPNTVAQGQALYPFSLYGSSTEVAMARFMRNDIDCRFGAIAGLLRAAGAPVWYYANKFSLHDGHGGQTMYSFAMLNNHSSKERNDASKWVLSAYRNVTSGDAAKDGLLDSQGAIWPKVGDDPEDNMVEVIGCDIPGFRIPFKAYVTSPEHGRGLYPYDMYPSPRVCNFHLTNPMPWRQFD